MAIAFCTLTFFIDPRHIPALRRLIGESIFTHLAILLYVFTIGISVLWSAAPLLSVITTVKYALIYLASLGVAAMIRVRPAQFSATLAYVFIPLGACVFFIYACFVFRAEGKSFPVELTAAVKSRSLNQITHQVFKPLLMQQEEDGGAPQKGNVVVKNNFAGAMFLLFCGCRLGASFGPRRFWLQWLRPVRLFTMLALVACITLLGSRSGLLTIALCLFLAAFIKAGQGVKGAFGVMLGLGVLGIVSFGVLLMNSDSDVLTGVQELSLGRFDDVSDDGRWDNFRQSVEAVQHNFPLGAGAGVKLPSGLKVHNNFLGGAFEAGLMGFLTIAAVYFLLLRDIISSLLRRCQFAAPMTSAEIWAFLAVLLPMFHCVLSGDSGRFTYAEWMCFALFWGFHGNRQYDKDTRCPRNLGIRSPHVAAFSLHEPHDQIS
ncbi:MAG: hypothetical protein CMJ46_03680 [Planctomyces sp.]|nr:hypothetical protein [Planctomyces sp.]